MKRIEYEIPLDCEIMALGDTHLGSVLCHRGGNPEDYRLYQVRRKSVLGAYG